ncbi:MAG: tail-specific protease [Blastopirellula sp.]|nr:MAG: tail-specific protease [Blastopirellula sp.]
MRPFSQNGIRLQYPKVFMTLLLTTILSVGLFSVLTKDTTAQVAGPKAQDRSVARIVAHLIKSEHLSKHPIDDEMSGRAFDQYLKMLDPLKLYFTQADMDKFMVNRTEIDDQVKSGDVSFGHEVFQVFLTRLDERVAMVDQILKSDLDFNREEEFVTDVDVLTYAKNQDESYDRWRQRVKYDLLSQKSDGKTLEEAREKIGKRYTSFSKRMKQTSSDDLLEMYLTSLTMSFDPHTTYMSKTTLENFQISMRLQLDGIGAALLAEDGFVSVTKVIPGGAADKHGKKNPAEKLQPEDVVVSVGQGDDGELVDVIDMKLTDVVGMIRGKAGTKVRLGVKKAGVGDTKYFTITRARIALKDSEARGEIIDYKMENGQTLKVGWIDLPSFYMDMEAAQRGLANYKSTTRDVRKLIDGFNEKGVQSIVLDLRRNGGGSLTESIRLTGLFIDHGPVVQVKDSRGRVQAYDDTDRGVAWDGPLVVLTSKMSASASEILAGAIQDYGRGLIVGDVNTHGKGTVQSLLDLGQRLQGIPNPPKLGALKITMQQFYRPNGESTQLRGVLADISLPAVTTHMDIGEGDLDYSIEWDQVPKASYNTYENMVSPAIINKLSELSKARIAASEDFKELSVDIKKYLKQKGKKSVNLNEEAFMALRKDLDKEKTEKDQLQEDTTNPEEIVDKNYYFDEVINITSDYVHLLDNGRVAAN